MKKTVRRSVSLFLILIVLLFAAYGIYQGVRYGMETLYPLEFSRYVEKYADENGLESDFVYAIIRAESGFNPDAVSSMGAKGLMQLMPDTFTWLQTKTKETLEEDALFDPETNVRYGTLLLSILKERYREDAEILCGYHAGMSITRQWLENPEYSKDGVTLDHIPYGDTRLYVSRVKNYKAMYNRLYDFEKGGKEIDERGQ